MFGIFEESKSVQWFKGKKLLMEFQLFGIYYQVIVIVLSYLIGAVPFGYLLTRKSTGLIILEHGSGNIGSTNVRRIAGQKIALQVQVLDMLKGLLPVVAVLLNERYGHIKLPDYFKFLVAFSTILGHNYSIFLRFRGGKGVNTTLGATLLLAPFAVFCSVVVYFFVKKWYGFVSAGSLALAITLPISGAFLQIDAATLCYLLMCCCMILFRHKDNFKRLLAGNEIR